MELNGKRVLFLFFCRFFFFYQSGVSVLKMPRFFSSSPSACRGHLRVGADGSSWTVQSPGGGTHTQWVSTALSVYAVPSHLMGFTFPLLRVHGSNIICILRSLFFIPGSRGAAFV